MTSARYGTAQTVVLTGFAIAYGFDASRQLFASSAARTIGAVLCASGLAIMLTAIVTLRAVIQVAPAPRESGHLVTRGIYEWLRHPIYTAIVVVILGLFLRQPTIVAATAGAVAIAFLMVKVRFEESLLVARYPAYAEYRRRTWGIIPGL